MITQILQKKQSLVNRVAPVRLPIANREGELVGYLRLLNRSLAADTSVLADLTDWRRTYMQYFLSHFIPSASRTQSWINEVVFPGADRLFFLIETQADSFVGNFALTNINASSAELDNLIRGRRGGGSEFIYFAECSMLWWLFSDKDRDIANLHVFSNNFKTILLHSTVGFSKIRSKPLFIHPDGSHKGYVLSGSIVEEKFSYDEMVITRGKFLSTNTWVLSAFQHVVLDGEGSPI